MNPAHAAIQRALAAHRANLKQVPFGTNSYYYAQTMIKRCEEALKIEDATAAWKHFIG